MYERRPTKHEYDLWNSANQRLLDATGALGNMIANIGASNLDEAHDVLQDLIVAHIRAAELADRHRREKFKAA